MVRVRIVRTKRQQSARGIHILRPTKYELEDAKGRARNTGFKTIWIHKRR